MQFAVRLSECKPVVRFAQVRRAKTREQFCAQACSGPHAIPRVRLPFQYITSFKLTPDVCLRARQETVLPLSEPIRGVDGRLMHEIVIPKDTHVFVSINAANTNPAIWGPDGREWKPERWLKPLPESVLDAHVPGVYANLSVLLAILAHSS